MNSFNYSEEDIHKIVDNISVLDYFQYLVQRGKVNFERKSGGDYYFRTDKNKFSVNETGFYDFKTGEGGKLIKAVMSIENKSWKEAMDFLKDFSNTYIPEDIAEIKRFRENKSYYAEGDIYEKLEVLEQDKDNISQEQYAKQKALLESVLPQKKELEDIIVSPNQEFVHNFIVGEVEKNVYVQTGWTFGRTAHPTYEMQLKTVEETLAEKFKDFIQKLPSEAFGNSDSWEVRAYVDKSRLQVLMIFHIGKKD